MIENNEEVKQLANKYYEYHYLESMHYLNEKNDSTKTIVVGSSYGVDGIFCELMEKSFNFCMHSQDLWYDGLHVQRAINNHSNIKNCVFCIGYYSFFYDLSQTKNNYKVAYTYDPLFNNTHHLHVPDDIRERVKSELKRFSMREFYHDFFENTRLQSSVHYIEANGNYVGGVFGLACSSLLNVDNYVGVVKGHSSVGGVAGGIKGKSIILLGKSSVFVRNINNVVGELYADSECAGGVLGDSDNPLELSGIHNDIGSIQAFGGGGGVSGCVEKIEKLYNIYNRLGIVRTEGDFGGILGKIRKTVTKKQDISNINSYLNNVAPIDALPYSGHVYGLIGSMEMREWDILNLYGVRINKISSYVNGLSCAENYAGLLNLDNDSIVILQSPVDITQSVFGAAGSNDAKQCYNIISSGDDKGLYNFSNSYWFSPDDDHYAPFGKDVTLNDIGLSGFGYDPSRISEIAADIKAWEPATESIELGGEVYELPVAFTKEQFFNRTGLTYNQSRYDDFDDWCRRVEQEYPELQGSVE